MDPDNTLSPQPMKPAEQHDEQADIAIIEHSSEKIITYGRNEATVSGDEHIVFKHTYPVEGGEEQGGELILTVSTPPPEEERVVSGKSPWNSAVAMAIGGLALTGLLGFLLYRRFS